MVRISVSKMAVCLKLQRAEREMSVDSRMCTHAHRDVDRLQIFAASDAGPRSGTDRAAAQRHFVGNSMEPDSPTRSLTSLHTNDMLDDMLHWRFLEQECQSELPHSNPGASQNMVVIWVSAKVLSNASGGQSRRLSLYRTSDRARPTASEGVTTRDSKAEA